MLGQSAIALAFRILAALVVLCSTVLLGRWFSPLDFGYFATVMAALGLLSHLCCMGFPIALIRFVGAGEGGATLIRSVYLKVVSASLIAAVIGGLLLRDVTYAVGLSLLPAFCALEVGTAVLRGRGLLFRALVPRDILWKSSLILLALWAAAWPEGEQAFVLFCGAFGVILILAVSQAVSLRSLSFGTHPMPNALGRTTRRLWASQLAGIVLANLDTLCVGLILGVDASGLYFAASRLANVPSFALNAVNTAMAPRIARHFAARDKTALLEELRLSALISAAPTALVWLVFWFWGDALLGLFGGSFTSMHSVLMILAAAQVVNAFTGVAGSLLMMSGHEASHAKLSLAAAIAAACLIPIAGIIWGVLGVAWATFIVTCGYEVLLCRLALARTGFDGSVLAWRGALA